MSKMLAGPLIAVVVLIMLAVGGPDRARTAARRILAGFVVFGVTFIVTLWAAYTTGNPLAVGLVRLGQEASGIGLRAPSLSGVPAVRDLPGLDPASATALAAALAGVPPPASPAIDALPSSDQQALAAAWQQVAADGRPGFDALVSALDAAEAASPGFQARLATQVQALPEGVDVVPGPGGARWGRDTLARALAGEAAPDPRADAGSADAGSADAAPPATPSPATGPVADPNTPAHAAPAAAAPSPEGPLPSEAPPGRFVAPPSRGLLKPIPFANPSSAAPEAGG